MPRIELLRVLAVPLLLAGLSQPAGAAPLAGKPAIPAVTRKVLYEKVEHGYRMRIVEAPVGADLLKPVIDHVYGLDGLVRAIEQLRSGRL